MSFAETVRSGTDEPVALIWAVLKECRSTLMAVAAFSGLINVLMLTGSFYMLQVYDRVLMSYSVPTLILLSALALVAYMFQGFLDVVRTRIFGRIAERIDARTGPQLFTSSITAYSSRTTSVGEHMQAHRDLEAIRSFLSGTGPVAAFDMPWVPVYLLICFLLHPLVGIFATMSSTLLICFAVWAEMRSHKPTRSAYEATMERNQLASASVQGAEAICAMGMLPQMRDRWTALHRRYSYLMLGSNDVSSGLASMSRTIRMTIQSAILGLGAYLVIRGEMTAGTIIAASVVSARAMAPVDLAVGSYRSFQQAWQGYRRLQRLFATAAGAKEPHPLPAPRRSLTVDGLVVASPADGRAIIKAISFHVAAGQGLGIIGRSASGKSTLGRALVGLWSAARGTVALDGASLKFWDQVKLGAHIGYLPHDVQLFDGSIAENIARFQPNPSAEAIHNAARTAGCYDLIVAMSQGFDTQVGVGGAFLSAGERQRIGLARAIYGDPFLVVLDEPNANLDASGEESVTAAIIEVRRRGGIAVVIAHRPSAIAAVDLLLVIDNGFASAFGRKEEVLEKMVNNAGQLKGGAGNHELSLGDGGRGAPASPEGAR